LEKTIRTAGRNLDRHLRLQLIAEPLIALDRMQRTTKEQRLPDLRCYPWHRLAGLLALLVSIGLLVSAGLAADAGRAGATALALGAAVAFVSGLTASGWLFVKRDSLCLRKVWVRPLAKCFSVLRPSRGELEEVLEDLASRGMKIGRRLRPEWIFEEMAFGHQDGA
jgi:hypothetical protein